MNFVEPRNFLAKMIKCLNAIKKILPEIQKPNFLLYKPFIIKKLFVIKDLSV